MFCTFGIYYRVAMQNDDPIMTMVYDKILKIVITLHFPRMFNGFILLPFNFYI